VIYTELLHITLIIGHYFSTLLKAKISVIKRLLFLLACQHAFGKYCCSFWNYRKDVTFEEARAGCHWSFVNKLRYRKITEPALKPSVSWYWIQICGLWNQPNDTKHRHKPSAWHINACRLTL